MLTSGVSGGVAVSNQFTGVSLTLLNDYAQIIISNAAPSPGPDTQGIITVSGTYPATIIAIQKVLSGADFTAGNWTNLQGVIPRTTGIQDPDGFFQLTANQQVDFTLPSVQGLYAVRLIAVQAPTGGAILVVGNTFPGTGGVNPAQLAALQGILSQLTAQTLALSDLGGADYLSLIGGTYS